MADLVERLVPESDHFGMAIGRARPASVLDVTGACERGRAMGLSLLVFRIAANATPITRAIERERGHLCDTLLTLESNFDAPPPHPPAPRDVTSRLATAPDHPALMQIAARAFHDFVGHWHVDDRIPPRLADDLYVAWTRDLCRESAASVTIFVIELRAEIAGYLACRAVDAATYDVALGAVDPAVRGTGLYRHLVTHANASLYEGHGMRRSTYVTQLANAAAVRAVISLGYRLAKSEHTYHVWL